MATPVMVSVAALATADADGLAVAQAATGAQYLVLNGALADESANNICAAQSAAAAGNLTINGAAAVSGVAYLPSLRRVYVTSAGNDSGITFTIYGLIRVPQGGYVSVVETITGANTAAVSTSKKFEVVNRVAVSNATAGNVTVGMVGIGTMDVPRRVDITSAGDDLLVTFTITGTNWYGTVISEVLTGADTAAATSVLSYQTVTGVLTSGATTSTVEVGSSATADSPWVKFDDYAANAQTAVDVAVVSGSPNWDIETSMDRPDSPGTYAYQNPAIMAWFDTLDANLVGETTSKSGFISITPLWGRLTVNSGTGNVRATFRQVYQS